MKTALSLLAVATILAAPSLSATQSIASSIQESAGELSPEVQRYVARGDEAISRLSYDVAAREYRRAAGAARHQGHLPSSTTWKLASALYHHGDLLGAAAALDQLTNEAALVGDLEVQALALYYAAWLGGKAGLKAETAARVARLEGLLSSRYMPVAIRDRLNGWLKTSREVAVRH